MLKSQDQIQGFGEPPFSLSQHTAAHRMWVAGDNVQIEFVRPSEPPATDRLVPFPLAANLLTKAAQVRKHRCGRDAVADQILLQAGDFVFVRAAVLRPVEFGVSFQLASA